MEKSKNITGKYHKDIVLERPKNIIKNDALSLILNNIRLLHGNDPAHASEIVKAFLKKEKVTILHHLTYPIDLVECDFFMFPKLK